MHESPLLSKNQKTPLRQNEQSPHQLQRRSSKSLNGTAVSSPHSTNNNALYSQSNIYNESSGSLGGCRRCLTIAVITIGLLSCFLTIARSHHQLVASLNLVTTTMITSSVPGSNNQNYDFMLPTIPFPRDNVRSLLETLTEKVDRLENLLEINIAQLPQIKDDSKDNTAAVTDTMALPLERSLSTPPPLGKYAYAFVIGGCNTYDKRYRFYLYDILIVAKILREQGSSADVVVFFQVSYDVPDETLLEEDHRAMDALGIKYKYMPKHKEESFYHITLQKFRILTLTEYDRVMFLDGDVVLRQKLDYLFDYSMSGVLKENIIFAGIDEPSHGGIIMVKPDVGDYKKLQNIIAKTETRGIDLPYPHWDNSTGWGHVIESPDYYEYISGRREQSWNFYGAFCDQGLILYWTKYFKKSVSVILRGSVKNWGPNKTVGSKGEMYVENELPLKMFAITSKPLSCWYLQRRFRHCTPPHCDIAHYTGRKKPWLEGPSKSIHNLTLEEANDNANLFWFYHLRLINERLQLNIDLENWPKYNRPNLGMFPLHIDFAKAVYERQALLNRSSSE